MLSIERNGLAGNIAGELHIGIQGPPGPQGPQGDPGPQGEPGKEGGSTTITLKYGVSSIPSMNTVTGWQDTIPQMSETYPYLWIEISTETITAAGGSSTIEAGIIGYYSTPGSGGNADLSADLKTALINYYTHVMPIFDDANGLSYINAILTALGAETRTEPETEEPDTPVEPDEPETVTYTITNALTNVTNSNATASVEENASYSATLTADDGYELDSVTVTMGGTDITATAYADGAVSIGAVTGNVVITASATAQATGEEVAMTTINSAARDNFTVYSDEGTTTLDISNFNSPVPAHWSADVFTEDTAVTITRSAMSSGTWKTLCIGECDANNDNVLYNAMRVDDGFGTDTEAKQFNYTVHAGRKLVIIRRTGSLSWFTITVTK